VASSAASNAERFMAAQPRSPALGRGAAKEWQRRRCVVTSSPNLVRRASEGQWARPRWQPTRVCPRPREPRSGVTTSTPPCPHDSAERRAAAGATQARHKHTARVCQVARASGCSAAGSMRAGSERHRPVQACTRSASMAGSSGRAVLTTSRLYRTTKSECAAPLTAARPPSLLPGSQRCACLGFSSVALPPLQFGGCWRGAAAYPTHAPPCSVPSPLSSWAPERRASPPSGRRTLAI
jgi:hypothetical protein